MVASLVLGTEPRRESDLSPLLGTVVEEPVSDWITR
jgi:hypothetical protein